MKWTYFLMLCITVDGQFVNKSTDFSENLQSYPCSDSNHIFLSPGVLPSGGTSRACLSRFFTEGSAHVTLNLVTPDGQSMNAVRDLSPGDGGCIDIAVPQVTNIKADLNVKVRYPQAGCTWSSSSQVRVSSGQLLLLQSERARYRGGELVRLRARATTADLTPGQGLIEEIWLEGPDGTQAASWRRRRLRLGLAQLQYRLDVQAQKGKWTVRARLVDGTQGSTDFWVGDYQLPPFLLSVRHAPTVLSTSERIVWNVCVRYPWSEAVEGMLVIRLRGAGGGGGASVRTAVRLKAPKACHRHAIAARRVGLGGEKPPHVVIADFSFQEDGTNIWQNTTVMSQVVDNRVSLQFQSKFTTVIAPGLPYKLKIKATRWDDKPSSSERLRVCRSPASHPSVSLASKASCDDAVTDGRGVARVMFTTSADEDFRFYRFVATLHNDSSISTEPLYLPVKRSGVSHAAFGPLSGDSLSPGSKVSVPLYLNLKNVMKAITVHFVVITRGGTIHRWGATSQCPVANSGRGRSSSSDDCYFDTNRHQNNLPRRRNARKLDDPEDLLDRHLLRIMLPIRLSHQMCPDSHLIAYFYHNNELVSASKRIEVEECFINKVQLNWLTRQTAPGSEASLQISTPGPALCALTATDLASRWMQPETPGVKETLMTELRRLVGRNRNMTSFDASGDCFMSEDNPEMPNNSKDLAVASLASAGVLWVGSHITIDKRCRASIPASLISSQGDVPTTRSDFSEAWLWKLIGIGANGSGVLTATAPDTITRYEATALCVSRNGITISSPAILQVFREFFIHADAPKKLRRGDKTIIKYRIFNYLYEPLAVEIQILTDPYLEVLSPLVETACISARSSISRRVEAWARGMPGAGGAGVLVRAVAGPGCGGGGERKISDEVVIRIEIEHEGIPKEEHRSALLCGIGSSESTTSKVTWSWPGVEMVPGSEAMSVWAVGDISGPLLADADSLISLPRGCGEQNMARMATNLLALNRLDPHSPAASTAKDHLVRGFARQLQYVHPGGGFSAFGSADGVPSTWLTGFAIRYLRKAHQVLSPGQPMPSAVEQSERWLLNQQMENGCFRNEGQVFHREMKGGLGEEGEMASVALTAYVITSLVEGSVKLPYRVLKNSLSCLRALPLMKTKLPAGTYGHALLSYTFMKLKKYEDDLRKTNDASLLRDRKEPLGAGLHQDEEMRELVELLRMARRSHEFVWWETGSLSTSIEATSYAILALASCPDGLRETSCANDARGAIRWLSTKRNAGGGFLSTQDTLVALEAISAWSAAQPSAPTNLNVTVRCGSSVQTQALLPDSEKLPLLMTVNMCDELKVGVDGTGCALVQATRSYHTAAAPAEEHEALDLSVQVAVHTDGPFDCDRNSSFCFCAAVVEVCVLWSGGFPEMALLEVTLPGGFGVDATLIYSQMQKSNTLLRRIETTPNGNRAFLYLGTRDGSDVITGKAGHQCYTVHAVGPKARTKAAYARVMDYYKPHVNDTQIYTISEDCPPKISNEKPPMVGTDNLYNSARSLNGDDPIISDESFDGFIDGAPLEDPIFDNLTNPGVGEVEPTSKLELEEERSEATVFMASEVNFEDEEASSKEIIEDENDIVFRRNSDKTAEVAKDQSDNNDAKLIDDKFKENIVSEIVDAKAITGSNKESLIATKSAMPEEQYVDNPNLSDFHVIDSDKDLEVPPGVNGPVPSIVLPPYSVPSQKVKLPPQISSDAPFPDQFSVHRNTKNLRRPGPNPYLYYYEYPIYRRSPAAVQPPLIA